MRIAMHIYGFVSMLFTLFMAGCEDKGVDPPPGKEEKKWEVVPEFVNLDIRYMIHFKDELYAAVVNYQGDSLYKGAVLKTSDGDSWSLVKTFNEGIGPMTVEGDSLYVNSDHFIHKMDANGNWVIKFGVPWQIAEAGLNGDMIFLNGNLYVSQTRLTGYMYMVTPDSQWKSIYNPPGSENGIGGAKFLKVKKGNNETVYLRRRFDVQSIISTFDGNVVIDINQGLSQKAHGINSLTIHNDTLFAGFKELPSGSSGVIMYLDKTNVWKLYHDSLPNSPSAFHYIPPLTTLSTVILFVNQKVFVATEVFGVLVWSSNNEWQTLNEGLMLQQIIPLNNNLYNTISFLEFFHGKLFIGYGNPAYTWGTAIAGPRTGLLRYELE